MRNFDSMWLYWEKVDIPKCAAQVKDKWPLFAFHVSTILRESIDGKKYTISCLLGTIFQILIFL